MHVHRPHTEIIVPIVILAGALRSRNSRKSSSSSGSASWIQTAAVVWREKTLATPSRNAGNPHELSHLVSNVQELDRFTGLEHQPPKP